MFDDIKINKCIHEKNSLLIITVRREVNLVVIEISPKGLETSINFIDNGSYYFLLIINDLIYYLTIASECPRQIGDKIALFFTKKVFNIVMRVHYFKDIITKTTLFGDLSY